jgi:putative Mn2+ efflux pump MntP
MNKTKCNECGLVNFLNAVVCKRCGNSLNQNSNWKFTPNNSQVIVDFTHENRQFGFKALAMGIVGSIAPWILTFGFDIVVSKLNAILLVGGFSFVVSGLGIILSPPKSKLDADENKPRNGILIVIGLLLGLVEAFFFNRALGYW